MGSSCRIMVLCFLKKYGKIQKLNIQACTVKRKLQIPAGAKRFYRMRINLFGGAS
ncbi:hypothetical protein OBV_10990 [Oscillibacter valericigenes Sjm18-20]|nr:hypothetical protein OBV_10990 [Oscillibacter valericigenes Sjm18-20]